MIPLNHITLKKDRSITYIVLANLSKINFDKSILYILIRTLIIYVYPIFLLRMGLVISDLTLKQGSILF